MRWWLADLGEGNISQMSFKDVWGLHCREIMKSQGTSCTLLNLKRVSFNGIFIAQYAKRVMSVSITNERYLSVVEIINDI